MCRYYKAVVFFVLILCTGCLPVVTNFNTFWISKVTDDRFVGEWAFTYKDEPFEGATITIKKSGRNYLVTMHGTDDKTGEIISGSMGRLSILSIKDQKYVHLETRDEKNRKSTTLFTYKVEDDGISLSGPDSYATGALIDAGKLPGKNPTFGIFGSELDLSNKEYLSLWGSESPVEIVEYVRLKRHNNTLKRDAVFDG